MEEMDQDKRKVVEYTEEDIPNKNLPIPDKNTAFSIFKQESSKSKEIEEGIIRNSDDLKIKKTEAKELLESCNNLKHNIENLKERLTEKKFNKLNLGDDHANIIDEEECKMIDDLKLMKLNYKDNLDKFKASKSEITIIKNNLDLYKVKYVETFENWFLKRYNVSVEDHELRLSKVQFIITT